MCKTYIINLQQSNDRRDRMIKELNQLSLTDFEFISAINGKNLSPKEIQENYDSKAALDITGREFTRDEIGCALSHQKAYTALTKSNNKYALILEDDIDLSNDTPEILKCAEQWLDSNEPRILLLTSLKGFCTKPSFVLTKHYKMVDVKKAWSGMGYLLNQAAAEQLILVNRKIWLMADDWTEYKRNSNITVKGLDPWVIQHATELNSILEEDRKNSREKKSRTAKYILKKLRENIGLKIVEYAVWRPFKGFKKH